MNILGYRPKALNAETRRRGGAENDLVGGWPITFPTEPSSSWPKPAKLSPPLRASASKTSFLRSQRSFASKPLTHTPVYNPSRTAEDRSMQENHQQYTR